MTAPAGHGARAPGYKPHLDGIRAFAVLLVICFHLGFQWIPGGFVGVDVFFVLSGYLITGLLLEEAAGDGRVRLRRFYARRVRRLLPASVLVITSVMLLAKWLLDAVQQQSVGRDAMASALYVANWRFAYAGGDYFAPGDVPSPLVHFWSLAVEEQFYLVWPALFWGLWRLTASRRGGDTRLLAAVVGLLALGSAVASVVLVPSTVAYYGTHTRAYQLLAGALLVLVVRRTGWRLPGNGRGRVVGAVAAVGATAALAWLAHVVPDAVDYPGWPALAVTAASLVLIVGLDLAPPHPARSVAGSAVAAATGRWSYSLYIWHWPVIVFLPVLAERWDAPWLGSRVTMVTVVAGVAGASYLLVERPVRFSLRPSAPAGAVVAVGLATSVMVAGVSVPLLQPRDQFTVDALAAVTDLAKPGPCPYFPDEWGDGDDDEPCVYRQGSGPTVAIVGDSHAQQWQPALLDLADRLDLTVVRVTRGGCPANDVVVYARNEAGRNEVDDDCVRWRRRVYPMLAERYDPDVVLVATRSHVRGIRSDGRDVPPGDPAHLGLWTGGWGWTLDTLSSGDAAVVVSEILPTLPERVPACLIAAGGPTTACDFPATVDDVVVPYNDALRALDVPEGVEVGDPTPIPCPDLLCPAMMDGIIVHRDDNHLSASFVRSRSDEVRAWMAGAGASL